ncbi:hypothetical protein ITP53_43515 [Nonomuraea sp. K274]|uniref:Histidine kinase-like protein n=1 Tax=Nonomuraea cypriaca TaxID=1187855 RepID=A0A931AKX2_9ACTN|nr:hypothetical protein [Nonomuraea cypriaca]MBF8192438.1 hypothetical protein [Nonomuraea cypriaca]
MDQRVFPGRPESAAEAERWVRDQIGEHVSPPVARQAAALARELVESALHSINAGAQIAVDVIRVRKGVRVQVADPSGKERDNVMRAVSIPSDEFGCVGGDGGHTAWATLYERDQAWNA